MSINWITAFFTSPEDSPRSNGSAISTGPSWGPAGQGRADARAAARSPRAGLAGTALLTLSTLGLLRVTVRVDRTAAAALIPYAAWCAFATTLNADIVRRNGGCR
ncbi:tryptophan-rich sensory protein [Streptomyces sp. NPDC001034]|uniref:tryptophan-rich sensory protein n=1 Tax=Streptomyces sp. NPDC001034 TaxID=3154375 RepID=UPI003325FC45